jgi:hypothetical protein
MQIELMGVTKMNWTIGGLLRIEYDPPDLLPPSAGGESEFGTRGGVVLRKKDIALRLGKNVKAVDKLRTRKKHPLHLVAGPGHHPYMLEEAFNEWLTGPRSSVTVRTVFG